MLSKKEYREAENFWITQKEVTSGHAYWHNLAVIYKSQDKLPHARFALEKANHLTLYSSETEMQLQSVVETLGFSSSESDSTHPSQWLIYLGPIKIWVIAILMTVGILSFLKKNFTIWVNIIISICSLLPLLGVYFFFKATIAFVSLEEIPVYNGASQLYASGQLLPVGSRLVGLPKGEWTSLRSLSGQEIWIRGKDLEGKIGVLWD